ncbi:hypothetical protein MNBD_GAMMA17-1302 [hydrothermal vent metagenome]|uniref:DUF11 domain-containing protein n=1 Tax=hydrothermal vent metagenome TaxID=652676 RepID=A0A3B0ZPY6_9ZZZZ
MHDRFTSVNSSLRAARKSGAQAFLRLCAVLLTALVTTSVLWSQATHAVPIGTSISNTASVSYVASGMSGLTANSNTEQFLVEDSDVPDTVTLTVIEGTGQYFIGGDTVTISVDITNTGANTQAANEIRMSVPDGSSLTLNGNPAASQNDNGLTTIHTFNVANISVGNTANFTALLTLPLDVAVSNNLINTAYFTNGATIASNVLTLNLRARTEAQMRLMQYSLDNTIVPQAINATEYDTGGGVYAPLAVPNIPNTSTPVTSGPIRLEEVAEFSHQQIIFISIDDLDRNINSLLQETVEIALSVDGGADIERLRLTEVGVNSGVFTGYITILQAAPLLNDGILNVMVNDNVEVFYQDVNDAGDVELGVVVVDPYGRIFNSVTGVALNGYTVRIVDMNTGLPATVFGDDGISAYPATVVTGGSVTDGSGQLYNFDNGSYRFPLMPVGNYQLIVEPPPNVAFRWPSTATNEALAIIPNGPFVVTLGSRGESFPLQPGPPLHIDIPIDPIDTPLYVTRSANKREVAAGDFIQFRIQVDNLAASVMNDLILHDELPHGFRIQENSIYIDGVAASLPIIANNGSSLRFDLGTMMANGSTTIEYVAAVGAVNRGMVESTSYAESGASFASSNTAILETIIIEELMRSRAILMGQVIIDGDGERQGLSRVRIFMEDGRYAITDQRGMYHFDDVKPGSHVLQLDTGSLPEYYEAFIKEDNTRFSGNATSQFVDVQGGSLWRADFYVAEKARAEGYASLQIENLLQKTPGKIIYKLNMAAEEVALEKVRLTVVLPDGAAYQPGSSLLGIETVADPEVMDNMLIYRLGDSSDAWHESLQYTVTTANDNSSNELISKVSMAFNVPSKKGQRIPLATHSLLTKASGLWQVTRGIKQRVTTFGEKPGSDVVIVDDTREEGLPEYDWEWLSSNANGAFKWLTPAKDTLPAIPSTSIVIKHDQFHRIELSLNGKPVPAPNYDGSMKNRNGASLSIWSGVDLVVGDNLFEVAVIDLNEQVLHRFTRIVHFSGPPVRAELVKEQSILTADGSTNPVIAVRLFDRDGYPARDGVIGRFEINPAYKVQREDSFEDLNMPGASLTRHEYRVLRDGIVEIKLEPTTESGDVELNFLLANNIIEEVNAPLRAKVGEWILVGLAEGSVGHNKLSNNIEPLSGSAVKDNLYSDGRIAFYGKGQVLGRWILTLAYDSDKGKPLQNGDPGLFQQIDPGKYYTIYGDTAYNGFDARSSEKFYLKLERDEFYFLYGDYQTNLDNVELAQYSRTLTGIKSRYHAGGIDVVVFASESNQAFVKDEIRGASRSGPYPLSRNKIAMNSEVVTIEVRDRFRSEIIIDRREMARHSEYDIDYRAGTITFRESVYSTDAGLNPVFIVVKYESFDQGDETLTMGGHAEVKVTENTSVGVTRIDEGRVGGDAEMDGINVRHDFAENVQLKVEVARSHDERASGELVKGNAYTAEFTSRHERLDSRAYVREQEAGFGLGQSPGSENGSRKLGVDASLQVTDRLRIKGQLYRQDTLSTEAVRDFVETKGNYQFDGSSVRLGARSVRDERGNGDKEISDQITAGASKQLWEGRLVARIDREQNLSSNKINSSDFPNKTRVGVDYRLTQSSDLFVEHELTDGDLRDTRSTLMGIKSTPWEGGKIYTGLKQSSDDKRTTTSANVALQQKWLLNENWSLDVGAEESRTMSDTATTPLNANVPFASGGGDDFNAASIGLTYAPGDFLWSGRLETRNGSVDDTWGIASSVQTTPNQALSTLLSLQHSESERITGERSSNTAIRLGTAYRPQNSRWILLDKLDLKWNEATGGEFDTESWRIINNFNANFKQNEQWQHSFQYGMKTVNEVINNRNYQSFVDLMGIESRYNINAKWDAGVHANVLNHWDLKQRDYNSGLSVGHTLAKNIWVSVGYNFVGFTDKDFSAARYTSKGVYLKFRVKFDQNSARDALQWLKK